MIDLQPIKTACLDYRAGNRDDEEWPVVESRFHVLATDPERILLLIEELEHLRSLPSGGEIVVLSQLVRDMAGYIRITAGDKVDPVRDDLLEQSRQVLGQLSVLLGAGK